MSKVDFDSSASLSKVSPEVAKTLSDSLNAVNETGIVFINGTVDKAHYIDSLIEEIEEDLVSITSDFFDFGRKLSELKGLWDEKLTKTEFYKFCQDKFSLSKSSICNFIAVFKTFRKDNYDYIDDKYKNIPFSKLIELIHLEDKEALPLLKDLSVAKLKTAVSVCNKFHSDKVFDDFLKNIVDYVCKFFREVYGITSTYKKDKTYDDCEEYVIKIFNRSITIGLNSDRLYFRINYVSRVPDEYNWFSDSFSFSENDNVYEMLKPLFDWVGAYQKYINSPRAAALDSEGKKVEKFVPTGTVKKLGLKQKDICRYVDDIKNYNQGSNEFDEENKREPKKDIIIHLGSITIIFRPLDNNPYIYGKFISNEGYPLNISDIEKSYSDDDTPPFEFEPVDTSLQYLSKFDKEALMMKEKEGDLL